MAHGESAASLESGFSEGLGKRAEVEDPEFDVTAMVDLVSLMNIYFIVVWVVGMANEVDLPAAKKVVAGNLDESVVVMVKNVDSGGLQVIIGEDATDGEVLTDRADILKKVEAAVKAGAKERKNTLILKAEKKVALKDIAHVAGAAAAAEGIQLRLAVLEKDK